MVATPASQHMRKQVTSHDAVAPRVMLSTALPAERWVRSGPCSRPAGAPSAVPAAPLPRYCHLPATTGQQPRAGSNAAEARLRCSDQCVCRHQATMTCQNAYLRQDRTWTTRRSTCLSRLCWQDPCVSGMQHLFAGSVCPLRRRQLQCHPVRVHRHALHRRVLQHCAASLLEPLPGLRSDHVRALSSMRRRCMLQLMLVACSSLWLSDNWNA